MDSSLHQQQEQALAAALRHQQQQEGHPREQQKQQDPHQEQQQEQQPQQQSQHLSLHSAHDALNHDALSNRDANGSNESALQATLASNDGRQLILQHAAAATGNLLHHHDLSDHQAASHVLQASHDHSSDPTTTAAVAAAAVAAAATAATLASLENLDSVVAEAVVAASKSVAAGSVSSATSAPSVAAVAAISTGTGLASSSSSSSAVISSNMASSSSNSSSAALPTTNSLSQEGRGEGSGERYDKCPAIFKWPADDWETWLDQEKTSCRWNMVRHRHRDKQTFARGPTASEWTREFQCDHAGQYRDRKNPNIDPSKKRKRNGSIKCNCPAFIKMRKQFHEDEVLIEYSWKHEGHIPDVMEDIKAQRLPQDLKAWIKERVNEGLDWKTVKNMMNSGSPMLDEVLLALVGMFSVTQHGDSILHPATKQNIKVLLTSCYALFANTSRQIKNKSSPKSTSSPSSERATRGNVIRFEEKSTLAQRLSQPSSPQSAQQSSSSSSREAHSSAVQDPKQSTSTEEATHMPQTSTWQIVPLESTQANGSRHGFTVSDDLHSNSSGHDNQTIAVHTLTAPGSAHTATHAHLQHQVLAISEPLLNAESISRVIQEQGTAQDMAALSLVTSASMDATNGSGGLGSMASSTAQTDHDADAVAASTVATVASLLYNSSREHSSLQEAASGGADTSHQGAADTLMESPSGMEGIEVQNAAVSLQQQIQQHVHERSPRDMMLEVLRAIADLHKQMEATEQYGTQEDAMEIIESFANPIRLMKEALERRSSGSQP